MTDWTRRNFLKSSAAATGAALLPKAANAAEPSAPETQAAATGQPNAAPQGAPRERLLFDFGWRFHLGNAADPDKDFGFGDSAPYVSAEFAKTGELFAPSRLKFDDSHWRALDLPHDWAVELPFVHDPVLTGHGSKPLGRAYPETSIGWYRRVFHVPAGAAGRRLSLEFDGVFRNAMVALNGDYLGRNMSGYAPFRFDITDFVEFGADNVLVVRVDATEQEGWFYEGAGIYRHVWLVKTAPLHIPQWGVVVRSALHGATAEVEGAVHRRRRASGPRGPRRGAPAARLAGSGGLASPGGRAAAARRRSPAVVAGFARALSRRRHARKRRANQRPLRANLRHSLDPLRSGARLLSQRPAGQGSRHLQSPGPCRRRRGAARPPPGLPHRTAQGDGRQRLSHLAQSADARTARCLRPPGHAGDGRDADVLLLARRPEPTGATDPARPQPPQRDRLVHRQRGAVAGHGARRAHRGRHEALGAAARSHPSRDRGDELRLGSRTIRGRGHSGLQLRQGRGDRRLSRAASRSAHDRHRSRQHRLHPRHLRERSRPRLRQRLRPQRAALGRHRRTMVAGVRFAAVPGRRLRLDRLRLSRRADALRLALHQLPLRDHGYLRLPQGQLLLLPGLVERAAGAALVSALELGGA